MYGKRLLAATTAALLLHLAPSAMAVDSDGDGVDDSFDNCIEHANADQRDSNADGFGNRCDADFNGDLITNVIDLGYLRSVFFSADQDADLDGDGSVNVIDLGIFRSLFFRPPGPAGENSTPPDTDPDSPPQIDVSLRVIDGCPFANGSMGHDVTVAWESPDLGTVATVNIQALPNSGQPILSIGSTNPGNANFIVNDPYGGPLQVVVQAQSGGVIATGVAYTTLTPCMDRPIIPPGLGFQDQPQNEPPVIGVPDGTPDEVDVITLGGSTGGPVEPRAVVAAGTGAGFKLFAYEVDFNGNLPLPLTEAGPVAGIDVKLHTLEPENHSFSDIYPFVSGYRREGNLWIRSWQLVSDETLKDFTYNGYGENAQVTVEAYDIAHRILDNGDFQVVTPIRTARNHLRLITWRVDRETGEVFGQQDSGDWGTPHPTTELSIAHLTDKRYVVTYRSSQGVLTSRYWSVGENGMPDDQGGMTSGWDIDGDAIVSESMTSVKALPLGRDEFVTPLVKSHNAGDFEVGVWETRRGPFDEGLTYQPYKITDSDRDAAPNSPGIIITPQPTPTNATDNQGGFLQNVRALLTDGRWEGFGVGDGELFSQMPNGELTSVHLASVSKVMTLLLAVEAIDAGTADLDDLVVTSAIAANIGGSQINLEQGEVQTLETLLHGMMLRSGNDASVAIAEHISGDWETFTAAMQARADALNLDDTFYLPTGTAGGTPAGGGLSTPQDQITLWRAANQNPLFREIAEVRQYTGCGETSGGQEKCYFLQKFNDSGYPGLEGWKNGNTGFAVPGYSDNGGPYCVGSGCLVAQTTRLGRTMLVGIQQSGNRWGDHDEMLDYGYRLQFTPDRRGAAAFAGNVVDFALDHIGDPVAVLAKIDRTDGLQICTWSLFADLGQKSEIGCDDIALRGVAGSADSAVPAVVDGALISTFLVEGDYVTANTQNSSSSLFINLWRVAPTEP